jgi:hypothetical protein
MASDWWLLGALGSSGALGGILGSMGLGETANTIAAGTSAAKMPGGGGAAPPPPPPPVATPTPAPAAEPPPAGGGGLLGGLTPGGGSATEGVPPLLQRPPTTTASLPTLGAITDVPELGQYSAGASMKPTPDTYPLSGPNLPGGPGVGTPGLGVTTPPPGGAGGGAPSEFWQSPFGRYLQARTGFGPHPAAPGQAPGGIDLGNPGALPGSGGRMGPPQVAPGIIQMAPGLQGPTMGAQDAVAAGLGGSGAPGSGFGQGGGIERVLQALLRQRQGPAARSLPVTSTLPGGNAFYW